ncbi:MiaB/RimO family radical SAM methylthiotransferase [Candidatus Shapirobacteria bacterium]|nr:MiaB/RimO family radical SAM methylthiotransferase [Candidatus Shapirobacteria bacterium]
MGKLTFLTYSLGCRVNQAEIEEIITELTRYGFHQAKGRSPNLVLINTCVVTQKAERETRKAIRHFRRLYSKSFLVVVGCSVSAKQKMKINLPEADLFISNEEKGITVQLIKQKFPFPLPTKKASFRDKYLHSGRKLIKIQDGCNRFCGYCIVPYLRGKPRSKTPEEIIQRCKDAGLPAGKAGIQRCKEIILTGTNLHLYGMDLKPKTDLTALLREILEETRIERISLSSLDPQVLNKEFAKIWINDWENGHGRLSRYWHLSLQSGSSTVLTRMGRKTDTGRLLKILQYIKRRIAQFVLRADIIIGFPGETEKEFRETLQFIKQAKITYAHVFPFSRRPGTMADKLIGQEKWRDLPANIKRERVKTILAAVQKIRGKEAKKLVSQVFPCLFIRKLKNNTWETLADNSWKVLARCENEKVLPGQIREIKILGATDQTLNGKLLPED